MQRGPSCFSAGSLSPKSSSDSAKPSIGTYFERPVSASSAPSVSSSALYAASFSEFSIAIAASTRRKVGSVSRRVFYQFFHACTLDV